MKEQGNNRLLIFSIALNGYQWLYRDCLSSHQLYADKLHADYIKIDRPWFTRVGTECCWLKLLLLKQALDKDYNFVLFLDADAEVQPGAPDIRTVVETNKDIYMAMGKTQRFNSGVVLLRNTANARQFVEEVLSSRNRPLARRHDVGWGENGHIIQAAEGNPFVSELPVQWNNTWRPELQDYIRHYNHGIMRDQKKGYRALNFAHKSLAKTTRFMTRLNEYAQNLKTRSELSDPTQQLQQLFLATKRSHPQLF